MADTPLENEPISHEQVNAEIDPEWEVYWNKLIDDTTILTGLLLLQVTLSKSDYPDDVKKKLRLRIKKLIRRYDEPFRRQKDYNP